jgi:MFS family permease
MVGLGETYLSAFVLVLGFSPVAAGLITTIPVVVGSTIQLLFSWIYKYLKSYRMWVVRCARTQAITLMALAALPYLAPQSLIVFYLLASLYWTCTFSAGPAWNAWMGELVPAHQRVSFFTQRTRRVQFFTFLGLATAGLLLQYAETQNLVRDCFSALLITAGLSRLGSAYFVSQQMEKPKTPIESLPVRPPVWKRLKEPKLLATLTYFFILQFTVYIAAPYFSPYMLKELNLNYSSYMFLSSVTLIARVTLYPLFQKLATRLGALQLVWIGTLLVMLNPFFWTLSKSYYFLMGIQVLSGIGWGLQELGVFLLLLERFPADERSRLLTIINFLNSLGMLLGSILGSYLLRSMDVSLNAYYFIFTASTLGRLSATLILPYLKQGHEKLPGEIFWRIVGLRPNLGFLGKPILYYRRKTTKKK